MCYVSPFPYVVIGHDFIGNSQHLFFYCIQFVRYMFFSTTGLAKQVCRAIRLIPLSFPYCVPIILWFLRAVWYLSMFCCRIRQFFFSPFLCCVTEPPSAPYLSSPASGGSGRVVVYLYWSCLLCDYICTYDGAQKTPLRERPAWKLRWSFGLAFSYA